MAKPTPLPLGRANPHVLQSRGAEPYVMNFYVTSYSSSFTKPNTEIDKRRFRDIPAFTGEPVFKPRSAPELKKTGFTTNVRPQIYYDKNLDEFDNPEMGRLLEDNYTTVTQEAFQPYPLYNGTEEFPVQVAGQNTAYTQTAYNHNPKPSEVRDLYIDTKIKAPYDVLPKHKAKLHKLNDHNPLSNENHGYGPFYMSTETSSKFVPNKKEEKLNPLVGPKEISGFVSNKEAEDVLTGEPGERWLYNNTRPTGLSEFKDRFKPFYYAQSDISLPNLVSGEKTKDSTYVKAFKASDINPRGFNYEKPSEYKDNYLGERFRDPKLSEKLGTATIGAKELGGQSRNEHGKVQTLDDPNRFITNYQVRHYDMNPKGAEREGYINGGVQNLVEDGYTKNVKTHYQKNLDTLAEMRQMDSYQSRSIRGKDQYYDDHAHDHKLSTKTKTVTFNEAITNIN